MGVRKRTSLPSGTVSHLTCGGCLPLGEPGALFREFICIYLPPMTRRKVAPEGVPGLSCFTSPWIGAAFSPEQSQAFPHQTASKHLPSTRKGCVSLSLRGCSKGHGKDEVVACLLIIFHYYMSPDSSKLSPGRGTFQYQPM